ncbi:MAG: S8 family serine peptidase [Chitinophagaceae bacterium]|nr:S8 family serine peptidase [Chitinophagaceae bacterium]
MRRILLFLALSTIGFSGFSQQIHLKSGTMTVAPNLQEMKTLSDWQGYGSYAFAILQFNKSTSSQERAQITEATGIQFFEYIPRWAFIAAIPKNLQISTLGQYQIKSVSPYRAEYKMAKKIIERPFPDYMVKGNGRIELYADLHTMVSQDDAVKFIAQGGYQFISWKNAHTAILQLQEADIAKLAAEPWIKYLQPLSAPAVLENLSARSDHRINVIDAAYVTGMHYDGTGVSVAVGDDGVIGPHIDFKGRLTHHTGSDNGTHADHVCGIVAGGGNFDPVTSGNGRGADLHIYSSYGNLNNAPTHYNTYGVRITSNSLGQGCNDGYDSDAQDADILINSKPSLMSIHSAGNSGASSCGGVGGGFYTITGGYKAGKNVMAIGNVEKDDDLASSSSRGPSEDGRIKPEVCAVGTNVYSTQPDNAYDSFTGTSMACPGVSGTMASLWQAYRDTHAGADPSSALMKCLLMNTADDLGNFGPDFKFGFGRINARRAVKVMNSNQYIIDSMNNGDFKSYNINVPPGTEQVKVMLYWHDIDGNPGSSIVLVNNLNMSVLDPTAQTYTPWVLNNAVNVGALNSLAVRALDSLNNVEQVTIEGPQPGMHTIQIDGADIPQGPQVFVITYEFISDSLTLTYPQGGESMANGVTERVRWDAYDNNLGTFKLEYSSDAGTTWTLISNSIQGDRRYYDWSPSSSFNTGQMLMRIARGAVSDVSDTLFSVIGVPTGLTVDTACGTNFHLTWNPVTGASGYTVYMLGNKYMDVIGTSTTTDFYVSSGVNMTDTFYFAVAAIQSSNGAKGRRCIAYQKLPGEVNCLDDAFNESTTLPFTSTYTCAVTGLTPVTMKVRNIGLRILPNIPVSYQVNAQPIVNEVIPGPINIGDSVVYTFSTLANMSGAGTYNVRTWTKLTADINNLNDTTQTSGVVNAVTAYSMPTVEDFEGPLYPPTGWRVIDNDTNVKWQKTLCLSGAYTGNTHAAYMDFYNYAGNKQIDDLETPQFDLTSVTYDSVLVTFDVAHAYGPAELDTLSVWLAEDCATTFIPLNYKKWGTSLSTVGMMTNIFSPTTTSHWRNDQVDISAWKGKKVFLRFKATNNSGNNLYLDNVNLVFKNATPLGFNQFGEHSVQVYPNPSDGHYIMEIRSETSAQVLFTVYSTSGQRVKTGGLQINPGTTQAALNLSELSTGMYILELNDGAATRKIKLNKY